MKFFISIIFAFSLNLYLSPLTAMDLYEGIQAWEKKEDVLAAKKLAPLRKVPIVRPYWENLIKSGVVGKLVESKELDIDCGQTDLLCEDIKEHYNDKIAYQWFDSSIIVRKYTDPQICLKKLLSLKTAAAYSTGVRIFKANPGIVVNQEDEVAEFCRRSVFQGLGRKNELDQCIDVMSLLECGKMGLNEKSLEFVDKFLGKTSILQAYIVKGVPIGEALFKLSILFKQSPPLYMHLVKAAGFYGCMEAQLRLTTLPEGGYWLMNSAMQGHPESLSTMAAAFDNPKDVKYNPKKSFCLSELAIKNNVNNIPSINYNHAIFLAEGVGTDPNPAEARRYFDLAIRGEKKPLFLDAYGSFLIAQGEIKEAKDILIQSARAGYIPSITKYFELCKDFKEYEELVPICQNLSRENTEALFLFYEMCISLPKEERIKYYKSLFDIFKNFSRRSDISKKDKSFAFTKMGVLILYHGMKGNGIQCLEQASTLGSGEADCLLGQCYETGFGVKQDLLKARAAYERGAQRKEPYAYLNYGKILMDMNTPKMDKVAVRNFQSAFEFSEVRHRAAFNLALMTRDGRGCPQDEAQAEVYFREAMTSNALRVEARYLLALMKATDKKLRDLNFDELYDFLNEGVENEHPNSLLLMGQVLLCDPIKNSQRENRKQAVNYIKKAIQLGAKFSKPVYLFYCTFGVEGVLKSELTKCKIALEKLNDDEKESYFQLLDHIYPDLKDLLTKEPMEVSDESSSEDDIDVDADLDEENADFLVQMEPEVHMPQVEKMEEVTEAIQQRNRKYERIQSELESMIGKRQVKWSKVKALLGKAMLLNQGVLKPGKGSGLKIHMGEKKTGIHIPHGSDSAVLKGGALQAMLNMIENDNNQDAAKGTHDKK